MQPPIEMPLSSQTVRQSGSSPQVKVATRMLGGLGNQLFQYAAGRALAARLKAELILDCTKRPGPNRPFVLDRCAIDASVVRDAPGKVHRRRFRLPGTWGRQLTDSVHDHFPTRYRIADHSFQVFAERQEFHYDRRFEALRRSTYLTGYWQSYRYFECSRDVIRSELRPRSAPSPVNREWLDRIGRGNSVCLHVRRGDYLAASQGSVTCTGAYYAAALAHVRRFLVAPRIFVFSDDMEWCRSAFTAVDVTFVDTNGPDEAVEDLRLMAACRHHIIANSSLSWWGAWLADHPAQVVIAPRTWFPWVKDSTDLLPRHWIRLSDI